MTHAQLQCRPRVYETHAPLKWRLNDTSPPASSEGVATSGLRALGPVGETRSAPRLPVEGHVR